MWDYLAHVSTSALFLMQKPVEQILQRSCTWSVDPQNEILKVYDLQDNFGYLDMDNFQDQDSVRRSMG